MMRIVDACESCGLPQFPFHPALGRGVGARVDNPPRPRPDPRRAWVRGRSVDSGEKRVGAPRVTVTHRPGRIRAPAVSQRRADVRDGWRFAAPLDKLALVPAIHIFAIGFGG